MSTALADNELVWDPAELTVAQRAGDACVSCRKRWPRPRCRVGVLPDRDPVYACRTCVALIRPAHK